MDRCAKLFVLLVVLANVQCKNITSSSEIREEVIESPKLQDKLKDLDYKNPAVQIEVIQPAASINYIGGRGDGTTGDGGYVNQGIGLGGSELADGVPGGVGLNNGFPLDFHGSVDDTRGLSRIFNDIREIDSKSKIPFSGRTEERGTVGGEGLIGGPIGHVDGRYLQGGPIGNEANGFPLDGYIRRSGSNYLLGGHVVNTGFRFPLGDHVGDAGGRFPIAGPIGGTGGGYQLAGPIGSAVGGKPLGGLIGGAGGNKPLGGNIADDKGKSPLDVIRGLLSKGKSSAGGDEGGTKRTQWGLYFGNVLMEALGTFIKRAREALSSRLAGG